MARSILQGTQLYDSKYMQGMQWANALINLTGALALSAASLPPIMVFGNAGAQTVTLPPLTGTGAIGESDSRVQVIINSGSGALTVNAHANDGGGLVASVAAGTVSILFSVMKLATPKWFAK